MTLSDAVYRLLLQAFPRRIRAAHGDDMARVFALQRRELAGRPAALAALWLWAIVDALIGVGSIVFFAPVIQAMLFEVSPLDPTMVIGAATVLTVVACAACVIPAWRAARVDPLSAIRQ